MFMSFGHTGQHPPGLAPGHPGEQWHANGHAPHGMTYQDRNSGMMVGSHMNMIPVARPVQSIHGIGPKANYEGAMQQQVNQPSNPMQMSNERDQPDFRRTMPSAVDNRHLSHHSHQTISNRGGNEAPKSNRQFPAKAVMQWDYVATREDELSAMAGETILIAGEYKNAGWLWGARFINGQPGGFRLIPANYIDYQSDHPQSRASSFSASGPALLTSSAQPGNLLGAPHNGVGSHPSSSVQQSAILQSDAIGGKLRPGSGNFIHNEHQIQNNQSQPQAISNASTMSTGPIMPQGQMTNAQIAAHSTVMHVEPSREGSKERERSTASRDEHELVPSFGEQVSATVGDLDDPFLDGMYEDESGLASVYC